MPLWRGWSEELVRSTTNQVRVQCMAGFTAINALATASASTSPRMAVASIRPEPAAIPQDIRGEDTLSAVSEDLGIGQNDKKSVPAIASRLHKPTKKSRKRVSAAQDARQMKRHKPDNTFSDGMHACESASNITADASSMPLLDPNAEFHAELLKGITRPKVSAATEATLELEPLSGESLPHAVPVYTTITSMDVLDSTSARTSLDSVMASGNMGCTVYQNTSTPLMECSVDQLAGLQRMGTGSTSGDGVECAAERLSRKAKAVAIQNNSELLRGAHGKSVHNEAHRNGARSTCQLHRQPRSTFDIAIADESMNLISEKASIPARLCDDSLAGTSQLALEDELDDSTLLDLAKAIEDDEHRRVRAPPFRIYKQNMREVDEYEDYGGALLSASERAFLSQHTSELAQEPRPITRKAFPRPILDRSSVAGATNATVLRTCFRLGEALNAGSQAVRTNKSVMIELYARVMSSWREPPPGRKQHFVFADVHHDKAPHIRGTFELFSQAPLWDLDSQAFLKKSASGSMCRTIVRMKRDPQQKWRFEVLSIWQAGWEDVMIVRGIIDG